MSRWSTLALLSCCTVLPAQEWWSQRPLRAPAVPKHAAANPIDAFVGRKLAAEGLQFAPAADRRTLIRRLAFDLHGLPPTPKEIDAFIADQRADAYERLVDRLLASPRYGERWARHWLDVVHYGETHGYDKDKLRRHAWPYRDYVIRALNEDKAYGRFVREQIAGDVMYPGTTDGVVATGFIAAGPWDFVGHVELREGTADKMITRSLDRDDMLRNAMSTFVSTTAHCARCHDHKFDPIPQRDYYRLQAVFAGVERADRTYPDPEADGKRANLERRKRSHVDQLAKLFARAHEKLRPKIARLDAAIAKERRALSRLRILAENGGRKTNGYHSAIAKTAREAKWVQVDLGRRMPIEGVTLFPAHVAFGGHPGPGFGFPRRFRVEVDDHPSFKFPRTIAEFDDADFPHPGNAPVALKANTRARYVRITATHLWHRTKDWIFALGELAVWSGQRNAAAGKKVTSHDSIEAHGWSRKHLVDGLNSRGPLVEDLHPIHAAGRDWTDAILERHRVLWSGLSNDEQRIRYTLVGMLRRIHEELAALPPPPRVYAATRSFKPRGNFRPPTRPREIRLLDRGDVKRPRGVVQPGALSSLRALAKHFERGMEAEGDRRAALARWLTDHENPLTWRSIVNRVWQYHFGRGLVTTPSDFGKMGGTPSHPELLDWLAVTFRDGGQSLKDLHRRILLSRTYRQSSTSRPDAAKKDAGNRLLWRMNRRRLEAEAVRDSVLAVSGRLDLEMGGPSVMHFGFKDDHSPHYDYEALDVDSRASRRRSIYRWIVRSVPDPFLERMDCPDASLAAPVRFTTITAPQALSLLNHRFMVRHSEHFASRLIWLGLDLDGRIDAAWQIALGRRPTDTERKTMRSLAESHGLEAMCRAILNLNEFLFID